VPNIRINDESLSNQTGADWLDFHWVLFQHGHASFNQGVTIYTDDPGVNFPPAGVFDVYPFTQYVWDNAAVDIQKLSLSGGLIPDNGSWFPGLLSSGYLEINVDIDAAPEEFSFSLKELPTPEPATLSLLAIGALALLRRRR